MATGQNLRKPDCDIIPGVPEVMNVLSKDVQIKLRKHQYNFVCKRYKDKKSGREKEENKMSNL